MASERQPDVIELRAVLDYCRAHRLPCWIIRTPPESRIGGFSAELIELGEHDAVIQIANGDRKRVPQSELSFRAAL